MRYVLTSMPLGLAIWNWVTRAHPLLGASLLTIAVGFLDHVTGTELRVFLLYFVPLALVAGSQSRGRGLGAASALTAVWAVLNFDPANIGIYLGNVTSQFVAFTVVAFLISEQKLRADLQQQLASTDALTGLLNSRAFFRAASRELAVQTRKGYERARHAHNCERRGRSVSEAGLIRKRNDGAFGSAHVPRKGQFKRWCRDTSRTRLAARVDPSPWPRAPF